MSNQCIRCQRHVYLVLLHDGTEAYVGHNGRLVCAPFRPHGPGKRKRKRCRSRACTAREPYCNATASDRYGEHRCALLADHNGDCVCDCCEEPLPSGAAWEPDTVAEARGDK